MSPAHPWGRRPYAPAWQVRRSSARASAPSGTGLTRRDAIAALAGLVGVVGAAPAARPADPRRGGSLTDEERLAVRRYLEDSRDDLLALVGRLSPVQWRYRPSPEVWSAADNLEHVILVERDLQAQITTATSRLPALPPEDRPRVRDVVIPLVVTNRDARHFTAPEPFRPTGRWPDPAALPAVFGDLRAALLAYVRDTDDDLRSRAWDNPLVGLIDGYQWIWFVAGHAVRHTKQVRELLARPDFPARAAESRP
ncbi:MAG: DinB family protein [Vicinamibacterales bacterium]